MLFLCRVISKGYSIYNFSLQPCYKKHRSSITSRRPQKNRIFGCEKNDFCRILSIHVRTNILGRHGLRIETNKADA